MRYVRTIAFAVVATLTPAAHAYIIAIAGAAGFEDQPFIDLIQSLATEEQLIYDSERPAGCTNFYTSPTVGPNFLNGEGYLIILEPTGPNSPAPDWPMARNLREDEIQNFQGYLQSVDLPCECREYLHIIGFSDGASTIGGWLNIGALNTQAGDDHYSVIGLVDVIRQFGNFAPNMSANATWAVIAMPAGREVIEYTAFRNKSGDFLACGSTLFWEGHRILTTPTPWMNSALNQQNVCHPNFPNTNFVKLDLVASIQAATMTLIDNDLAAGKCSCITVSACPDLDNDGDMDLDDWEIMQVFVNGPTSGSLLRGPILGDIDGDGDVDLRDFGLFQRAFSVFGP